MSAAALQSKIAQVRQQKQEALQERNNLVAALACVFPAGRQKTLVEGWDPHWCNVVTIELPTGQVRWHYHDAEERLFAHLPLYEGTWDGHTREDKAERITDFCQLSGDISRLIGKVECSDTARPIERFAHNVFRAIGVLEKSREPEAAAEALALLKTALFNYQPALQKSEDALVPDGALKDEQGAFEAHARSAKLNMEMHPLHYLFTDPVTYKVRQGWRAALDYVRRLKREKQEWE